MPNRIDQTFKNLKKQNKKAFIAFITAGDPNLKTTEELVLAFEKAGVDIVELGVPFSDPLADGPTIQASSQRALEHGVTLRKIFNTVSRLRNRTEIPIALMMYYNQIFHYGEEQFVRDAKKSGVDGLIVPDLPPEEAKNFIKVARQWDVATTFFVSPTTANDRIKTIAQASTGFIYYVSITGVTGARTKLPSTIVKHIKTVKRYTAKPVCVGFGISSPQQVKSLAKVADGVIVGSAIVNRIRDNQGKTNLASRVGQFVTALARNL